MIMALGVSACVSVMAGQPCCAPAAPPGRDAAKAPASVRGATIDQVAFLTGDWSAQREMGDGQTNHTQEVWSEPSGNNMMDMFRWVGEDGRAAVFELLTITEEDDTLALRLRHQDAQGNAWEAPDKPATLHLTQLASGDPASDEPTIAVFTDTAESCDLAACEYDTSVDGRLKITVRFDDADRPDLVFDLGRGGGTSSSPGAGMDAPVTSDGAAAPSRGGREKAPGGDGPLSAEEAREVFDRFAALDGEWIGRSTRGWEEKIVYQTAAQGSVVVERSFDAHPGEQMYTMVHMDGDRLMLTHYCVAGNQPRLVCTGWERDEQTGQSTATFEFLDATNLESRDGGHMDKVVVRFLDEARFTSQWTWYQDGVESWMEEITHERVAE